MNLVFPASTVITPLEIQRLYHLCKIKHSIRHGLLIFMVSMTIIAIVVPINKCCITCRDNTALL